MAGLYVVMGVAGSGKSLIGSAFARALGVEFVDGDDYHSPNNLQKMAAGVALNDQDRAAWLRELAARLKQANEAGQGLVVACSALKRSYRNLLRADAPHLRFIYLHGPPAVIANRMKDRRGHYMPVSLLKSQFAALEEPGRDEHAWKADVEKPPDEIVADLVKRAGE